MSHCYTAVQPNGERRLIETWAVRAWLRRDMTDPLLLRSLAGSVRIIGPWGGSSSDSSTGWADLEYLRRIR